MQQKTNNKGAFLVLLGAFCFSGSGTIQALAPEMATPFILGAIRLLFGGLFLLAWCAINGILTFPKNWIWKNAIFSVLLFVDFKLLFFLE